MTGKKSEAAQSANVLFFTMCALALLCAYFAVELSGERTPQQTAVERCINEGGLPINTAQHKTACLNKQVLLFKDYPQ